MNLIPNEALCLDCIPGDDAPLDELVEFAHTFNGYESLGSFEKCAEVANHQDHRSLDNVRACLFFEARRWRHSDEEPDAQALLYWHLLIARIREFLVRR